MPSSTALEFIKETQHQFDIVSVDFEKRFLHRIVILWIQVCIMGKKLHETNTIDVSTNVNHILEKLKNNPATELHYQTLQSDTADTMKLVTQNKSTQMTLLTVLDDLKESIRTQFMTFFQGLKEQTTPITALPSLLNSLEKELRALKPQFEKFFVESARVYAALSKAHETGYSLLPPLEQSKSPAPPSKMGNFRY